MPDPNHHVYFIHGIGQHSKTWVDDPDLGTTLRKKLSDAWSFYQPKPGGIDDHLVLNSVSYDHVFTELYAHWDAQAEALLKHVGNQPLAQEKLSGFIETLRKPAAELQNENPIYTHLLDLFWYRLSGSVQGKIVAHCASQILDDVRKHYEKGSHTFSIVGHSMGTSVAHKVLQDLFSEQEFRAELSSVLKFRLLMQVSNTSLVLSSDPDKHYETLVKPSRFANRGVCDYMVNVAHRFDPVCELVRFDPDLESWLDRDEIRQNRYQDLRISRLTDRNIHSIVHYFDNPKVQEAFFENIFDRSLPAAKKTEAWKAFETKTPEGRFKQVKKDYEEILRQQVEGVEDYLKLIDEFTTILKSQF